MTDTNQTNAQRLTEWMQDGGRQRLWVAKQLGVASSTITRWCNGDIIPSIAHAIALAKLTEGAVPVHGWAQ